MRAQVSSFIAQCVMLMFLCGSQAPNLYLGFGKLPVDVVDVILHVFNLLCSDVKAQLLLSSSQSDPHEAPCAKLLGWAPNIAHLFRGIALHERVLVHALGSTSRRIQQQLLKAGHGFSAVQRDLLTRHHFALPRELRQGFYNTSLTPLAPRDV
jgi:hypothetical protein